MEKQPLISVIVPVYKVENYIAECATSLFTQTYSNIEYIFVNDGSPDASLSVLNKLIEEKFFSLRDRIVIVNKENEGLPMTRKVGLQYAKGEYILHVDSDDWLETNAIEILVRRALETNADFIYFDLYDEYEIYQKKITFKDYTDEKKLKYIRDIINFKTYGYLVTRMVRKSVYLNNIIHPRFTMHEDNFLTVQLIYNSKGIVHDKSPLYHYRRTNPNSVSAKSQKQCQYEAAMNFLDLYDYYIDKGPNTPIKGIENCLIYLAGRYVLKIDKNFLGERDLARKLLKAKLSIGHMTIYRQIKLKILAFFYIKKQSSI